MCVSLKDVNYDNASLFALLRCADIVVRLRVYCTVDVRENIPEILQNKLSCSLCSSSLLDTVVFRKYGNILLVFIFVVTQLWKGSY